jgi:hypothetical protein
MRHSLLTLSLHTLTHSTCSNETSARIGADAAAINARAAIKVSLQPGDLIILGNSDGYGPYAHIGIHAGQYNQDGQFHEAGWIIDTLNEDAGVVKNTVLE